MRADRHELDRACQGRALPPTWSYCTSARDVSFRERTIHDWPWMRHLFEGRQEEVDEVDEEDEVDEAGARRHEFAAGRIGD